MGGIFSDLPVSDLDTILVSFNDVVQAVYNEDAESTKDALSLIEAPNLDEIISRPIEGDHYGRSVLHVAAWSGMNCHLTVRPFTDDPTANSEILRHLLSENPSLEAQDMWGWTPLWAALYKGRISNAHILMDSGALVPKDPAELTYLLDNSVKRGYLDVASWLFKQGAVLSHVEDENVTFLHITVGNRDTEMTRLLLDMEFDPNVADVYGWYPLHLAAGHNDVDACKLLIEHRANVYVKDKHGNMPLAWAKKLEANEAFEILKAKGGDADAEWIGDEDISALIESSAEEKDANDESADGAQNYDDSEEDYVENADDYGPSDIDENFVFDQDENVEPPSSEEHPRDIPDDPQTIQYPAEEVEMESVSTNHQLDDL